MKQRSSSIFPAVPESCVYFLENLNGQAIYIGRVGSYGLSARLLTHSKMAYFKEVSQVSVIRCISLAESAMLEPYYINQLQPPACSEFIMGQSRVKVNEESFKKDLIWTKEKGKLFIK